MRIDAHHHVWDLARRAQPWLDTPELAIIRRSFGLTGLAPAARAADIERTVLVQVLPDLAETREFLELAAADDLIAGVVGWADLTAPGIADTLAELRQGTGGELLVGVRHLVEGEADPAWLARPDVRRGLGVVGAAGLCYDLLTLPHQLPAAIETVRALPEVSFVLDHLSKPPIARGELEPWAGRLRELAREPNVSCKLSGLVTEADPDRWTVADLRPYAEVALDAFGPERLMFGSDWPVCLLAAFYEQVVSTADELTEHLEPHERAQAFGGTAARVYGIPVTSHRLSRIDRAETAVRELLERAGVRSEQVRVRDLGDTVRIELDLDVVFAAARLTSLSDAVAVAGFGTMPVVVDGFVSGRLNHERQRPASGS